MYNTSISGCSSVGRARGLGPRGRWFETSHSDQPPKPPIWAASAVISSLTGLERRLLATVRWTVATAVAFPQKSETSHSDQKSSEINDFRGFFLFLCLLRRKSFSIDVKNISPLSILPRILFQGKEKLGLLSKLSTLQGSFSFCLQVQLFSFSCPYNGTIPTPQYHQTTHKE